MNISCKFFCDDQIRSNFSTNNIIDLLFIKFLIYAKYVSLMFKAILQDIYYHSHLIDDV